MNDNWSVTFNDLCLLAWLMPGVHYGGQKKTEIKTAPISSYTEHYTVSEQVL